MAIGVTRGAGEHRPVGGTTRVVVGGGLWADGRGGIRDSSLSKSMTGNVGFMV
jgi:hypothetical protein